MYLVMLLLAWIAGLMGVAIVLCRYPLRVGVVTLLAYICAVLVVVGDVSARANAGNAWPMLVVVVDYLLVMQVPERYSVGLVCTTVVYLVVMGVEERIRFGVLDVPYLLPQEERRLFMNELSSCTNLPCARDTSPFVLAAIMVFIVDFIATRGFAREVLREKERMARTISVVQEIASLLAGYDVEQVAEMLDVHGGDLPEGMTEALKALEKNLRMYKAYLPKTCLPFQDEPENDVHAKGDDSSSGLERSEKSSATYCPSVIQPLLVQQLGLSSVKATLLTVNVKDALCLLADDITQFSDLFTTLLLKTLQATETRRGMVDVFIGDRIHCSFNASKQCASHATSALHAATLLIRAGVTSYANVGVATGTLLRGDMGCEVMRRFSMVGELVRDVNGLERVGRMLGCDVVCNRMCFSDAECEHQLRLLPCKVEVASGCEAQVVAEVMSQLSASAEAVDEWMYMIGGKKHWEEYNTAVRGYLRGEQSDLDVAEAWTAAGGVGTPAHAVPSGTCSVVCSYLR